MVPAGGSGLPIAVAWQPVRRQEVPGRSRAPSASHGKHASPAVSTVGTCLLLLLTASACLCDTVLLLPYLATSYLVGGGREHRWCAGLKLYFAGGVETHDIGPL